MIYNISFKGIVPPYRNKQNYYVTPIAKNPSQGDIDVAINATKTSDSHSGLNGCAYFLGEDLVVKKYKTPEEVYNYNPNREISALDSMYDNGILSDKIQRGEFAFTTPQNETYLVSTRIKGANSNPISNKFNKENLKSIVKAISKLDMPHKYEPDFHSDVKFPYVIPMHYDISMGNYNITENDGGIFDFEYLEYEDLNKVFTQMNYGYMPDTLSDLSDISGIISNLRNFEYRGLLPYLKQIKGEEATELFKNYLEEKSFYHLERAQMFHNESMKLEEYNPQLQHDLYKIAEKEFNHFKCLTHLTPEIIKAEAIKIQLASFIYLQSPFSHSTTDKINPEQIKEYIQSANDFFDEQINNSKGDKKHYFRDCKELMKSWNNLPNWIDYQEKEPQIEYFIPQDEALTFLSEEEINESYNRFESALNIYKLFKSKLTNEYIITLDEHLNI